MRLFGNGILRGNPRVLYFCFARTFVNNFKNNSTTRWDWACYPLPHHDTSLHFPNKRFLQPWVSNWENGDFFNASAVFQPKEECDTALRSALHSMFITLFSTSRCAQIFLFFPWSDLPNHTSFCLCSLFGISASLPYRAIKTSPCIMLISVSLASCRLSLVAPRSPHSRGDLAVCMSTPCTSLPLNFSFLFPKPSVLYCVLFHQAVWMQSIMGIISFSAP